MLKKSSGQAKKQVKKKAKKAPLKATPAEKRMIATLNGPVKGVKVKTKWSSSQISDAIGNLNYARGIVQRWLCDVESRPADKQTWSDNYYRPHVADVLKTLGQFSQNLYTVRGEM